MTTQQDLLLAILSMDSYNRGYGAGLIHGENVIGTATFKEDSSVIVGSDGKPIHEAAGFYAASYTLADGTTVISYRGTDGDTITDVTHGWPIALSIGDATL